MPVFLYTDIEGSTQLWEKHGEAMGTVLDRHDEILLGCIEGCGGRHVKNTGDGMMAVFDEYKARPLECALQMQRRLAAEKWMDIDELRVRMALHAGPAEFRADDYFGPAVNRLARLMATAWGGQIILTPEVTEATILPEGASLKDLGVHLLKDLTEPQQVYGLLHEDLPIQEFPALRSLSSHPNNLPRQPTPLVGREEELVEIAELLSKPDCCLLSLVAPGGMGKTRLGLQAAAEQIEIFRHGVFFVPLAGLTSAENLPSTIADALNLSLYGAEDLESQLQSYLHEKQLLLLLDNFEHLIDGVGTVTSILSGAPEVKIMVTSRERLRLQAEWTYEVAGLSVPENGSLETASNYGAVELFLQSARRVQPGFSPSPEDLEAIIGVCRLVDGMPLALELAAAWVNTLSCEEIAAEIQEDLDLLATEMHDVPKRQRSIRAVFDHSWNDLSPAEQSAFKQLSVFRGGFNRPGAREVTGATLRILSALINKSLLTRDDSGRFQVHELVRQYAAEKLGEDKDESKATKKRHAVYYSNYLKRIEKSLIRGARVDPIEEINKDLDNVLLAWRWAVEHRGLSLLEDSMRSLFWFYEAKAWYSEGEEVFRLAAKSLSPTGMTAVQKDNQLQLVIINLFVRQAWFASRLSHYNEALAILPAETELLYDERDLEGFWVAVGTETNTLYGLGNYETAQHNLERYDKWHERDHDYRHSWPWSKGQTLANLGRIAGALGDYTKARQLLQDALDILRPTGDQMSVMLYLHTLGGVVRILGDTEEARQLYLESLDLAETYGYPMGEALALSDLGNLAFEEGEYDAAKEKFESSLALSIEIGDRRGRALSLTSLGQVATALGNYEEAIQLYEQGMVITEQSGNRRGMALTLNRLSKVYRLMGDLDRADELCRESRGICKEIGYRKGAILAQIFRGEVSLERGDFQAAKTNFQQGLQTSNDVGFASGTMRSLVGLGRAAFGMGEFSLSKKYLGEALDVAMKSSMPRTELKALVALAETLAASGDRERGVELLALVADHPAADWHTKNKASEALEELRDGFSLSEFDNLVASGRAQTLAAVLETQLDSTVS